MKTPHQVDDLLALTPRRRAMLLHALRCAECQDALFTGLLEPPGNPVSRELPDDDPFRLRAVALDYWLEPGPVPSGKVEIPLLLAVSHFQIHENFDEAAATTALLGLYCTDIAPQVAVKCFRSALLHAPALPTWLRAFAVASYGLCLAQLGVEASDLSFSLSAMKPEEWIRFAWIRVRARVASITSLPPSELTAHETTLTGLLTVFAGSGSLEEAILVGADLARLYALRHQPEAIEPISRTLSDLAQQLEPLDAPVRAALEAFSALRDSPSFAAAAAPIYDLIPSIHRFASLPLLLTASEPLAQQPDPAVDLQAIRAFLAITAHENTSRPDESAPQIELSTKNL